MHEANFTYERDDDANMCGWLELYVSAEGFTATAQAYVTERQLAGLVPRLSAFPLTGASELFGDSECGFSLSIAPRGEMGDLSVEFIVAMSKLNIVQRATLQLTTDYSALQTFCTALSEAARKGEGTAILTGKLAEGY